jgi:hypothetical protein
LPTYPWPVKPLAAGDVAASLLFASTSVVSGVPVDVTLTLVNQTDDGVVIRTDVALDVIVLVDGQIVPCNPDLYSAGTIEFERVLPPRATATATCQYVPGDPGSATATVDLQSMMVPSSAPFVQTPVHIEISAPPETTTTTTTTTPG